MRIVEEIKISGRGTLPESKYWLETRRRIAEAVRKLDWPPGSGLFTIYPQSGKKRGEGNGVKPIKDNFLSDLQTQGWQIEGSAKNAIGRKFGAFDAVIEAARCKIALEWETGNISSSHRSLNKMTLMLMDGSLDAGVLVVPSRNLARYLTDRIGNVTELRNYIPLWKAVPYQAGVLEIIVIEHDAESFEVPRIPKATDGRAGG